MSKEYALMFRYSDGHGRKVDLGSISREEAERERAKHVETKAFGGGPWSGPSYGAVSIELIERDPGEWQRSR